VRAELRYHPLCPLVPTVDERSGAWIEENEPMISTAVGLAWSISGLTLPAAIATYAGIFPTP
jgi:hypothetical protein